MADPVTNLVTLEPVRPVPSAAELASRIEHTLLKPEADWPAIERLCGEAVEHRFAAAVVYPCWVKRAAARLNGTGISVGTVVGFPHGAGSAVAKVAESAVAISDGASDLDMVLPIGLVRSGMWDEAASHIEAVAAVCRQANAVLKVILECCYLTDGEKWRAAELCIGAGADYVKTSTGLAPGGATIEDVRLLRRCVGGRCRIKAAGGIRDLSFALDLLAAGADRLGTSAGVSLLQQAQK